jgi:hypothetical protein
MLGPVTIAQYGLLIIAGKGFSNLTENPIRLDETVLWSSPSKQV